MCCRVSKKSKAMSLYHRVNSLFCPFLKAPNQKNAYHATVLKRTKWSIVIQNVFETKQMIGFSIVCVVSPACTYVLANYSIFCDRLTNPSENDAKFLYCKGSYINWAISWTPGFLLTSCCWNSMASTPKGIALQVSIHQVHGLGRFGC